MRARRWSFFRQSTRELRGQDKRKRQKKVPYLPVELRTVNETLRSLTSG